MSDVVVRSYEPKDRDAVRQICFDTGLMGQSAAAFWNDFASFADMFSAYFTDYEPHNIMLAEMDGRVVGYTFGSLDHTRERSAQAYLMRHMLLRAVFFKPSCARFLWQSFRDGLADLRAPKRPAVDHDRYPSNMHINLLPEARRTGAAADLVEGVIEKLAAQGSPGAHADVLASNPAIMGLARKLRFKTEGAPYPVVGMRGFEGERLYGQLLVRSAQRPES